MIDHDLYEVAIEKFHRLLAEARQRGVPDTSTAALATSTSDGKPSVRTIDIRRVSKEGFVFFANLESGKGQQLLQNPRAALCFHWPAIAYQVIVEGYAAVLDREAADLLWRELPREYGLAHWASDQTQPANDAETVKQRAAHFRQQFSWERVPMPPTWGAFELKPERIDFWPTGWSKLRPRERYQQAWGKWSLSSEAP